MQNTTRRDVCALDGMNMLDFDTDFEDEAPLHLTADQSHDAFTMGQHALPRPGGHNLERHEVSRLSYDLGWDMAHYGVRYRGNWPEIHQMVEQGWKDSSQHFGGRIRPHDAFIKKWLRLRGSALARGKICHESVTAEHLKKIATPYCPILRTKLCYDGASLDKETQSDLIWSVDRLNNSGAYIAGNLVVMSEMANKAKDDYGFEELKVMQNYLRDLELDKDEGLDRIQWARLTTLASMIACNDSNWREIATLPAVITPPPEVFLQGAVWPMLMDFMMLPWAKGGGPNMGRLWMKRFRGKQLQRAAQEAAECFFKACFRLQTTKPTLKKWIAEDAWTNPAFQQVWAKFVSKLTFEDINRSVTEPESDVDMLQWRKDAGLIAA